MSSPPSIERLYALLPSIYKLRDAGAGEPLRALMTVMEGQLDTLKTDISHLFDNWFIETCDEWVVPYIGDLLGVRGQYVFDNNSMSLRPFVANTLRYRRAKGTAAMLEGLARDATGWPTVAVEYFRLLATTQHLDHLRAIDLRTPDLRDTDALERLGGPFETTMHFADVRRISQGVGKYNIGNVGLFLWRLESFPIEMAPAIPALADGPGRYRFSQLGADLPLFNTSHSEIAGRIAESDVPGPLRRRPVHDELKAARAALAAGETPAFAYLGIEPAFRVWTDGVEVPPSQIQVCNLADWATLPSAETIALPARQGVPATTLTAQISVDPVLGRLAVLSGALPAVVHVTYHVGFSAEIGGGPYARPPEAPPKNAVTYFVDVIDPVQPADVAFQVQLTAWRNAKSPNAVFVFRGPAMFDHKGTGIFLVDDLEVPAGTTVQLRAVDGTRPVLKLMAPWRITLSASSGLSMSGFLVTGAPVQVVTVTDAGSDQLAHQLTIEDTTLVPGLSLDDAGAAMSPGATSLESDPASTGQLALHVVRSITGRIDLSPGKPDFTAALALTDAIVDGCGDAAPALANPGATTLVHVTVLGGVTVGNLDASETIFDAPVATRRTQLGCVRYSYIPPGSATPRAFRCQPALALAVASPDDADHVAATIRPSYTSRTYGDPGYAQLALGCPIEIAQGAEAQREMGAFQTLMQPQRLANLTTALDEYLRFGLEAGVFLVT